MGIRQAESRCQWEGASRCGRGFSVIYWGRGRVIHGLPCWPLSADRYAHSCVRASAQSGALAGLRAQALRQEGIRKRPVPESGCCLRLLPTLVGSQLCLKARVQLTALGARGGGGVLGYERSLGGWPLCPHPALVARPSPCPRGRSLSSSGRGPEGPDRSGGPLLGPSSTPGLSEDNPPVQVIPTPTPLVPRFQVLLLDLLEVLQQLCVVDAGGICFL